MEPDNIFIIFGDSISYGLFDNEQYGWVNRIKNKSDFMEKSFYFNMSIPGQNSNKIVDRFDLETKNRFNESDHFHIIFSFGINDSVILNQDPSHKERFDKNVKTLIKQAKKYTANIYFIGLPTVDLTIKNYYNKENIDLIDKILKENCQKNKIPYICVNQAISTNYLVDGVHLTPTGHQKMADYLYDNLFKKIEIDEKKHIDKE